MKKKTKSSNPGAMAANSLSLEDFTAAAYAELRRIAAGYFKNEKVGHTLQPTALVHEVYIRLTREGQEAYVNRAHFFSVAARAMRQILVEHARARNASKRTYGTRVPLDNVELPVENLPDYLAIDTALNHLQEINPRLAKIAELRIFGGLSEKEAADAMNVAASTLRAEWRLAREFLEKHLADS